MNLTLKLLFERSLVRKTNVQLSDVDYIIMGTVIQEVKTANIAREVIVQIGSFIQDSRKDYFKKNKWVSGSTCSRLQRSNPCPHMHSGLHIVQCGNHKWHRPDLVRSVRGGDRRRCRDDERRAHQIQQASTQALAQHEQGQVDAG